MRTSPSAGEAPAPALGLDLNSLATEQQEPSATSSAAAEPRGGSRGDANSVGTTLLETPIKPPDGSLDSAVVADKEGPENVVAVQDSVYGHVKDPEVVVGLQDQGQSVETQWETKHEDSKPDADQDIPVDDGGQELLLERPELPESAEKKTGRRAGMKRRALVEEADQRGRYQLSLQEKQDGFSVSDLVWGKVRSHPWWPGQIYDPKDASEMAVKLKKKDHLLVAYYGDKTFAWCEESQLRTFEPWFSQMERQSSMDAFMNATNAILEEVSRRIELGMTCSCVPEEAYMKLTEQKVENAGIREGMTCLAVDRSHVAGSFQPDRLIEFIKALAVSPSGGADKLELVTAKSQLKAFYQSKGQAELPAFLISGGLVEGDAEILPSRVKESGKDDVDQSTMVPSDSTSSKRKSQVTRTSSSKKKNIVEDGRKKKRLSELMDEKDATPLANGRKTASRAKSVGRPVSRSSDRQRKAVDIDSGRRKRKRLDSLGDLETKMPSSSVGRSLKVGDSIRRIASQMTRSPPIFRSDSEASKKSTAKVGQGSGRIGTDTPDFSVRTGRRKRGGVSRDYPPPSEVLSQLCLAARDPMKGYSFLSVIVSFFSDFRASVASGFSFGSLKGKKHVEENGGRRGRKRSANSESGLSKLCMPDYMQDSYWSDILFQSSPENEPLSNIRKRKGEAQTKRQNKKKKKRTVGESYLSPPSIPVLDSSQELKVGSRSLDAKEDLGQISNAGDQVDECSLTALILSFTESDALPCESDLVKIFSRYGPLKESETEVLRKTNQAKVVFQNCADAEIAFSSAGKYSMFGPELVSYRLKYLSSTRKASPNSSPQSKKDDSTVEGVDLEAPAEEEAGVASDNVQVEATGQGTLERSV